MKHLFNFTDLPVKVPASQSPRISYKIQTEWLPAGTSLCQTMASLELRGWRHRSSEIADKRGDSQPSMWRPEPLSSPKHWRKRLAACCGRYARDWDGITAPSGTLRPSKKAYAALKRGTWRLLMFPNSRPPAVA